MARLLAGLFFCLACVVGGACYYFRTEALLWKGRYEAIESNISSREVEAHRDAEAMRKRAHEALRAAEGERQEVKSAADRIRDDELQKIYPDLKRIEGTLCDVRTLYVINFSLYDESPGVKKVVITYQNNGGSPISPDIRIEFVSKMGLATGDVIDWWVLHSILPGERRVETTYLKCIHGEPLYWRIAFNAHK